MTDDVILDKPQVIERCVNRVAGEYQGDPTSLQDFTKQDSIILNIQRACEAAIDIAMHVTADQGLGVPQNSREAFDLLYQSGVIDQHLATGMKAMVGFRNIAVRDYQSINLDIVQAVIERDLQDIKRFGKTVLQRHK